MLIVQIAVGFLIQLLLISNAYANSSTNCYEIGNQVHCDTAETPNPSGGLFGGLHRGMERFIERRDAQQQANAQAAYYQQQQQEAENIRIAQEANTRRLLRKYPDIVFRSEEYNQIADLVEIGYEEDDAYKIVTSRRK